MKEKAKKYLVDILQAINLIEEFSNGIADFFVYQEDLKTKSAVERQLSIIGEAVNQFTKEEIGFKLSYTRQIIDFRNRLIHSYDQLDDSIVWVILRKHLPVLKLEVENALDE